MKIAIVNTLPVPSGVASVNRLLSYGKELVKLGAKVDVLTSAQCDDCVIEGVNVTSCRKGGSLFGALCELILTIGRGRFDIVILVSNSLLLIYPLWFACKCGGVKILQEKSEYPFVLMKKGLLHRIYAFFYVNTTYRVFDGIIIMTKPLMDYFKTKVRKDCRLHEMPMTVDTDRFDLQKTQSEYGDYIAYCGDMGGNKDGVNNLIEAFNKAFPHIGGIKLLLIGGSSNELDWKKIVETVKRINNQNIILYGKATRDQIPSLLKNAKALALARPSSLQSTGGFPTKLGEYLATGNPIVVTSVGDIPLYLNNSNSFIVPPDDNDAFAKALIELFDDYDEALLRGENGMTLALTTFNAKIQSKKLFKYLQSFL